MKEIKAYVRRDRVNQTVKELEIAGAPGITVVEVHPVGYGYEPNYFESHYVDEMGRYEYLAIVRLEAIQEVTNVKAQNKISSVVIVSWRGIYDNDTGSG